MLFLLCRIHGVADGTIIKVEAAHRKIHTQVPLKSTEFILFSSPRVTFFISTVLNPCISDATIEVRKIKYGYYNILNIHLNFSQCLGLNGTESP